MNGAPTNGVWGYALAGGRQVAVGVWGYAGPDRPRRRAPYPPFDRNPARWLPRGKGRSPEPGTGTPLAPIMELTRCSSNEQLAAYLEGAMLLLNFSLSGSMTALSCASRSLSVISCVVRDAASAWPSHGNLRRMPMAMSLPMEGFGMPRTRQSFYGGGRERRSVRGGALSTFCR